MRPLLLLPVLIFCFAATGHAQQTANAAVATSPSTAVIQNPKTPEEFFARARQLSDLEASGIPFHLRATFVATGDAEFTGNGTYEEWWQSKDVWRKEATLEDYKLVEIKNGNDEKNYATWPYVPLRLRQTLGFSLVRIGPDVGALHDWKVKHQKLHGIDFEMLSNESPCGRPKLQAKCTSQDYFTVDGVLRIRVNHGVEEIYNNFQLFRGLAVPREIDVAGIKGEILAISILSIEPLSAKEKMLSKDDPPPANLQPITLPRHVDTQKDDPKAAKLVSEVQPIYPMEAKQRRIDGTVVIDAGIDEAGKVREPFVIHSAGALLDRSALDAVRQWRYSPTTLNSNPVCVSTTISVVYTLRY